MHAASLFLLIEGASVIDACWDDDIPTQESTNICLHPVIHIFNDLKLYFQFAGQLLLCCSGSGSISLSTQ